MSEMTFLTEEQAVGDKQLEILKKYGTRCAITDFAILLGGDVSSDYYTSEGNNLKDRASWWWTKTPYNGGACFVSGYGNSYWFNVCIRNGGARPVLPYSSIQSISSNGVRGSNGILEVEYGEYPQTIVDENYSCELEKVYNNGSLEITGKEYTTSSVRYGDFVISFIAITHTEYEYNGNKYIRFIGDSNCDVGILSDGRTIKTGQVYWARVEPITWLVDEKEDVALSKKILFAGVQYKNGGHYIGDFKDTDIKKFMDNYFAKEIISVVEKDYGKELENDSEYLEFLKVAKITDLNSSFYEELDKRVNKRVKRR